MNITRANLIDVAKSKNMNVETKLNVDLSTGTKRDPELKKGLSIEMSKNAFVFFYTNDKKITNKSIMHFAYQSGSRIRRQLRVANYVNARIEKLLANVA